MRTRVKFCGCTSLYDVQLAVDAGADAIGLIFAESPRRITLDIAEKIVHSLPPFVTPVGVFVDPSDEEIAKTREAIPSIMPQISRGGSCHPEWSVHPTRNGRIEVISVPQLHVLAEHSVRDDIAKVHVSDDAMLLFDTKEPGLAGGTGKTFAWDVIAPIARERRVGVAGGLTPENVGECIRQVRPYFVDVRSGIETGGKKDAAKMRAFIEAVREAD